MTYSAKIIADSVNPVGCRITTFELTYPRFVHSELLTHRMLSRNSASSRAIPVEKMLERVVDDPVMPIVWGSNRRGMQAGDALLPAVEEQARTTWLRARDQAVRTAQMLATLGVHKQLVNRVVEPWMFITVLVTATEWDNWFRLRDSELAQPEIAWVARAMRRQMDESSPTRLDEGEWHLPLVELDDPGHPHYVDPIDYDVRRLAMISAGRCARVSYLTHDGLRNPREDTALCARLVENGHWSPLEHPAEALGNDERCGNFFGWKQLRKKYPGENYGRTMS